MVEQEHFEIAMSCARENLFASGFGLPGGRVLIGATVIDFVTIAGVICVLCKTPLRAA